MDIRSSKKESPRTHPFLFPLRIYTRIAARDIRRVFTIGQSKVSGLPKPTDNLMGCENHAQSSCYIDALLFAMYISLSAFDTLLVHRLENERENQELQRQLRNLVNTLRSGNLVTCTHMKNLRQALNASGWYGLNSCGRWTQEDATELFVFLTDVLRQPSLPFHVRLLHGAKEDFNDITYTTERLLAIGLPPEQSYFHLETLLCDHFYNSIVTGITREVNAPDVVLDEHSFFSLEGSSDEKPRQVTVEALQILALLPYSCTDILNQRYELEDDNLVLPIVLKRYFHNDTGECVKDQRPVEIPVDIPFNRFLDNTHPPICSVCSRSIQYVMRLQSAICHKGESPSKGHYLAYARVTMDGVDYWLKQDDMAKSNRIVCSNVLSQAIIDELATDGYMFIYKLDMNCQHLDIELPDTPVSMSSSFLNKWDSKKSDTPPTCLTTASDQELEIGLIPYSSITPQTALDTARQMSDEEDLFIEIVHPTKDAIRQPESLIKKASKQLEKRLRQSTDMKARPATPPSTPITLSTPSYNETYSPKNKRWNRSSCTIM
ncbi:hypothetical protein BDF14DRAFT_1726055 [Spinellus fusiger]|nr:hypothetical protein BDF14DRAFT_1726055 [Spinellus fusiger]